MKRIITGDETWVYEYDMETEQQSSEWVLPNSAKKRCEHKSKLLTNYLMLMIFFTRWQ